MGTAIFVTTDDGNIAPLSVRRFTSESELDDCLAAHPEVLANDSSHQMGSFRNSE